MGVLLGFIKNLLDHPAPRDKIKELAELIDDTFQLMSSDKHMAGKNLKLEDQVLHRYPRKAPTC